jgi:hypothetical protein
LWIAPDPIPSTNRPPLISPTVAAHDASDGTDQYPTGMTEMPVPRPPGTTSALATDHWAQMCIGSRSLPALVQMLW